jgi:hypothetical protein
MMFLYVKDEHGTTAKRKGYDPKEGTLVLVEFYLLRRYYNKKVPRRSPIFEMNDGDCRLGISLLTTHL